MWRRLLIDWPARIVDATPQVYVLVVAALTLLCFLNVALTLLAWAAGLPIPSLASTPSR